LSSDFFFETITEKIHLLNPFPQVSVTDDNCQAYIPTFSCRLGVYIEGSVSPPLSGVHIRIFAAGDSSVTGLKSGELILETTTGTDGSFVAGPLYDDVGYNVQASKVVFFSGKKKLFAISLKNGVYCSLWISILFEVNFFFSLLISIFRLVSDYFLYLDLDFM
jgi:hypothetical protein